MVTGIATTAITATAIAAAAIAIAANDQAAAASARLRYHPRPGVTDCKRGEHAAFEIGRHTGTSTSLAIRSAGAYQVVHALLAGGEIARARAIRGRCTFWARIGLHDTNAIWLIRWALW